MTAIYPVFQTPIPAAAEFDGHSLSQNLDALDTLALSLGLTPLAALIDGHTMALEVFEADDLPDHCPPITWYTAQVGLNILDPLLAYFDQSPEALSQFALGYEALVAELRSLRSLLAEAAAQGVQFHLLVDL